MIFSQIKKNFVVVFFSDAFAKELGIYNITFQFKKYFLLLQFETCHIKKVIDYNLQFWMKGKVCTSQIWQHFWKLKESTGTNRGQRWKSIFQCLSPIQIVNRTSRHGQLLTHGRSTWGEKVAKAWMTSYALEFQIGRKLAWGARSKGKPYEALKCGSKCKNL